jgi:hypothetical protein
MLAKFIAHPQPDNTDKLLHKLIPNVVMAGQLSTELLYEVARYLDLLHVVRDKNVTSVAAVREHHQTIVNVCLASKWLYSIFRPLLDHAVVDRSDPFERIILTKQFLKDKREATKVRVLISVPASEKRLKAVYSREVISDEDVTRAYHESMGRSGVSPSMDTFSTLLTLLPGLEALQLHVASDLPSEYGGLLQLLQKAHNDPSILPRLSSVSIGCADEKKSRLTAKGIEHLLRLPQLVNFTANGLFEVQFTGCMNLPPPRWTVEPSISNITSLHLLSCDMDEYELSQLVNAVKRLEDFALQWSKGLGSNHGILPSRNIVPMLTPHASSLKQLTLDGRLAQELKRPFNTVSPLDSLVDFKALEYLDVPAILFVGKAAEYVPPPQSIAPPGFSEPSAQPLYNTWYMKTMRSWTLKQQGKPDVRHEEDVGAFVLDWDVMISVLPLSLVTLRLQTSTKSKDLGSVGKWFGRFVMAGLDRLPRLRILDLSDWNPDRVEALRNCLDFETLRERLEERLITLRLPAT